MRYDSLQQILLHCTSNNRPGVAYA